MSKKVLLLAAAALVLQATPVLAEGGKGDGPRKHHEGMFEKHDTNGDGGVSKDEFLQHAEERFQKMDADGDGTVSKEEGQAAREKMKEKWKEKREHRKEKKMEHREGGPDMDAQ